MERLAEVFLHAFRIGSARYRDDLLPYLVEWVTRKDIGSVEQRRRFLLLLRWARENQETAFVLRVLSDAVIDFDKIIVFTGAWWAHFGALRLAGPAAIDVDRASADLTYREAMDLRWAIDLWRESGAHWPGEPANPAPPAPAAPTPAKRRRPRR